MKRILYVLIPGMMLFTVCEKQTTGRRIDADICGDLVQMGGCQAGNPSKSSTTDSCFTYTFNEQLIIDFCVTGNCCPDTNRFEMNYTAEDGIIAISVADTAENLCRCICPYIIHAEFSDLPENEYTVKIAMTGPVDQLIYNETVHQ